MGGVVVRAVAGARLHSLHASCARAREARHLPVIAGVESLSAVLADALVVTAVVPLLPLAVALALVHAHVWGQHRKTHGIFSFGFSNSRPACRVEGTAAQTASRPLPRCLD